uniref:snRNA-activating protein complex subunit 3 n=1 Tax=Panagrolaimus sp. JU765 TaxID=591449 RepID=A0AC34RQ16_9BILA
MLIRGEMLLSKFRDKIFCPYDYFSNRYDFEDASNIADYYVNRFPSSFLFIHDTFYIDQRNDNAKDISEPIREFMTKRKSFGPTKVVDMANVKIKDLTLRLGQPYVFMHIGNCEHLVIFTDLRLLHPSDSQDLTEYPVLLCDKYQSPKCCVCQNASPAFIISESDRIPICPAFMCSDCFNEFHYEGDNRIGDFKAFHYIDHALGEF